MHIHVYTLFYMYMYVIIIVICYLKYIFNGTLTFVMWHEGGTVQALNSVIKNMIR